MHNTIFDDVFRTMIEKMPYLAVPLINEVFHTSYPENVPIIQLRNEHQQESGEVITDSCLKIGNKLYHIECQSVDDTTMAIRMIEYDFYIAVENAQKQGRRYRMDFPKSCVLYLRCGSNTPDFLEVEMRLPDENVLLYRVPAVKMETYTKDSIFEKNLLMLLPFYIMRYEKKIHEMSRNPELFQKLLNEYEEIRINLGMELSGADKTVLYMNLNQLIIKIADYICRNEEVVRKGIGDVMGGKVLELESERLERLRKEAVAEARTEGQRIGEIEGRRIGEIEGRRIGEIEGRIRGEKKGEIIGEIRGRAKGEERLSILINRLILDGRSEEIQAVVTDPEIRKQLYEEYGM